MTVRKFNLICMRKREFASPLEKHRKRKRKREGKIESSKMTKASGAGDSVALNCVLLLYCSGNTATSCVPLLAMFSPSPKDPRETEALSAHCSLGEPKSLLGFLSEHR